MRFFLTYLFLFCLWLSCLSLILVRTQSTLLAYEIGKLKDYEGQLLKKRSVLTMELARMSRKEELSLRLK